MPYLTREQILASATNVACEEMDVPEWGGTLMLRPMTGNQLDAWEMAGRKRAESGDLVGLRASMIAMMAVDPTNPEKLLFTEADVKALGDKSGKAIQRVFNRCCEINVLGAEDIAALKKK
jgi:hypothetical protein